MCIICNMRDPEAVDKALTFLEEFDQAQSAMRKAANSLLMVADGCASPEDRQRYRMIQKRMVRLRREWAQIEHQREAR